MQLMQRPWKTQQSRPMLQHRRTTSRSQAGAATPRVKAASPLTSYAPLDQNKGGGPYGDTEVSDEFYWAACELYITTGDKTYYDELMKYGTNAYGTDNAKALEISTTLVGGENNGSFSRSHRVTLNSVGSISCM